MIKRLLSYFIPVNVHKSRSPVSRQLEVTWNNGKLVLDSRNTNYSYGSLQRVLRKGLLKIGFDKILKMNNILVLGVGGGSVIKTLVDEVKYLGKIWGIDVDPHVIELADKYFNLSDIPNLTVVVEDAFEYVLKTKNRYELIIVDIFCDTQMPAFLFESFFTNRLGLLLHPGGFLLFNTMTLSREDDERNEDYKKQFDATHFKLIEMQKMERHNELILIKKLA